jgi:hypothetical protein
MLIMFGAIAMTEGSRAASLDQYRWKNRVLVVVGPARDAAVEEQRRIYNSSAKGMSERAIILAEALGDSESSRQIRARLAVDGSRFQVFLIGKDGNTAISSEKPLPADYLLGKVDAMPMRRDEMQRSAK